MQYNALTTDKINKTTKTTQPSISHSLGFYQETEPNMCQWLVECHRKSTSLKRNGTLFVKGYMEW